MKLLTRLAESTRGTRCGQEDWGSVPECVSRVRPGKEGWVLVAGAALQSCRRICVFPQESLRHTDSLASVKLHSEKHADRESVIKDDCMFKF